MPTPEFVDTKPTPAPTSSEGIVETKPRPQPRNRVFTKKDMPKAPREPVAMPKPGEISKGIAELYAFAGVMVAPYKPETGKALLENAEACGKTLEELAKKNESVRRVLIALTTTSVFGAVIAAHVPIIMAFYTEMSAPKPTELTEDTSNSAES